MSAQKVTIKRQKASHIAVCEQCTRIHPDSTRQRCRYHVLNHPGHTVRYLTEDVTVYSAPEGTTP